MALILDKVHVARANNGYIMCVFGFGFLGSNPTQPTNQRRTTTDNRERTTNYGFPKTAKNRILDSGYTYKVQEGYYWNRKEGSIRIDYR